jgi:hypothetical protein
MIPLPLLPRLLNWQGAFGIAASLCLFGLLLIQKGETRHWRKQASGFEEIYRAEQLAHARTVANYRAAADTARRADAANRDRVISAQADINERTIHDYETRLGDARTVADRLRRQAGPASAPGGGGRAAAMPAAGPAARAVGGPAAQDGFSLDDKLIATEQAIQLDELIKWVKAQAAVDNQGRDGSISH